MSKRRLCKQVPNAHTSPHLVQDRRVNRGLSNTQTPCRLFVGGSWLAKATVQAALASAPLDLIRAGKRKDDDFEQWENWGKDIITTSVFAILLTAPAGLLFINYFGERLLEHDDVKFKMCQSEADLPQLAGAQPRPCEPRVLIGVGLRVQ